VATRTHRVTSALAAVPRPPAHMNHILDEHRETAELVAFHCDATAAARVCVRGDFNNWNSSRHPMLRQDDGSWFLELRLVSGWHYYEFVIDGSAVLDPHAMYFYLPERHERVSLIIVG
jgi:1,4-alpha-glucan branching enzyme